MSKWTADRTQQFWERCGFRWGKGIFTWGNHGLFTPSGEPYFESDDYPPIDLNNLIKYAIPQVREVFIKRYAYTRYKKEHLEGGMAQFIFFLRNWVDKWIDPNTNPTLTLAEAIEKVLESQPK